MGKARVTLLKSAKRDSLQQGGVADFSEADRDALEARREFWTVSEEFSLRHHVMPREQLYVPKESSFAIVLKYMDVARQRKTQFGREQYPLFMEHGWT